jgi:ubiquinone/menaquinone biosynthesis C-methylase UbiE
MDAPSVDPHQLRKSLRYIRWINRLLGYTRATLWHLNRFSAGWKPGETITMLDVATGSADIPRTILQWAKTRGFDVRIVGLDRHSQTIDAACGFADDPSIDFVQADALDLPFASDSFDYALTSMFLHHLSDDDAVRVLSEMSRVARRGIIAADLIRTKRAYAWITLLTGLANPMVRHDARVSVRQAFSKSEALQLRERADIAYTTYFKHFGHRFILAGEKPAAGQHVFRH